MEKAKVDYKKVDENLNKSQLTLSQMTTERNNLIKQLASSENEKYETVKKYGKMKKKLVEYEEELMKAEDEIKLLKMTAQNNALCD